MFGCVCSFGRILGVLPKPKNCWNELDAPPTTKPVEAPVEPVRPEPALLRFSDGPVSKDDEEPVKEKKVKVEEEEEKPSPCAICGR